MQTFFLIMQIVETVVAALWHLLPDTALDLMFMTGLFLSGALASFINMLSGGGSMIVLSYMMLLGVDPVVANATNRVGVLISTATGAAAFKSEKYTDLKESLKLGIWSIPGAIGGAFFSVSIDAEIYEKILAAVMILIVVSIFFPSAAKTNKMRLRKAGGCIRPCCWLAFTEAPCRWAWVF
ncbi:MAG: sulfite exporter TauE/SafE family protein [Deltaproteobacteria bacterium]|nr:sulfite exporter TauE/SafE family protein [Deltaproteobacteria bacterium]